MERHRLARVACATWRRSSMPWQWSAWSWVTMTASIALDARRRATARAGRARNRPAALSPALRPGSTSAGAGCAARPGRRRPSRCRSAARRTTSRNRGCEASRGALSSNKCEEVGGGRSRQSSSVDAAQVGDEGGGVGDEGRLAGLAAMRHRREERRVGLDQQAVLRERSSRCPAGRAAFLNVTIPDSEM